MHILSIPNLTLRHGEDAPLRCTAPCSLQGELIRAGRLSDPLVGRALAAAAEAAALGCTFSATLTRPTSYRAGDAVLLHLGGVHGECEVLVGDTCIGRIERGASCFSADVAPYLASGSCELTLRFAHTRYDATLRPVTYDPTVGCVELRHVTAPSIIDVQTRCDVRDGHAYVHVRAEICGETEQTKAVAALTSRGGHMYYAGLSDGEVTLYVDSPELWRVLSEGEEPLYRLTLTLYHNDVPVDEWTQRMALGCVTVTGDAAHGRRDLILAVNGERVFLKGAVYTAPSLYPSERDAELTVCQVERARRLGINLLRLPPEAPFPSEALLSACDTLGVLLWKMLPDCPEDDGGRVAYLAELRAQLHRCGKHLCFAIVTAPTEQAPFAVRCAVRATLPHVFFMNTTELPRPNHTSVIWDTTEHPEGVQIEGLSVCRPPASLPSAATVHAFAKDDDNPYGATVEYHAPGVTLSNMFAEAARSYPYPYGQAEAGFITQLAAMDVAVEKIREARLSYPASSGVLLGPLFDVWTQVSPSLEDVYGRAKASLYGIRRALAPLMLVPMRTGYRIAFRAHNDRPIPFVGRLEYKVCDMNCRTVQAGGFDVELLPNSVGELGDADFSTLVFGHEGEYVLTAQLTDGRNTPASALCLFTEPRYVRYPTPEVRVGVKRQGDVFEVTLRSDTFVHGAFVTFGTLAVTVDDNLFDLTGELPVRMLVRAPRNVGEEELRRSITVLSIGGVGRPVR